ncbi:hypothetical protein Shyhy01_39560 [Streptomyces hygroscopicus subsp. hygroscopicus]|uniref:hypothetical protein n=1 Tax=Streptomyces sp. KHY 26 TaxID=3097359 RepID=UPI0024A513BF|nr:hypothetical protein [Streptomyces hygroscopicus]GLX51006.1 hypothetical protein Shyhy01_39560 [Streptomyces hygroscopicus subsp. hygroscopicus]
MPGPRKGPPHRFADGSVRVMDALTASTLVAVTAHTVTLGGDGRLRSGGAVPGLLTLVTAVTRS